MQNVVHRRVDRLDTRQVESVRDSVDCCGYSAGRPGRKALVDRCPKAINLAGFANILIAEALYTVTVIALSALLRCIPDCASHRGRTNKQSRRLPRVPSYWPPIL
ncbi:hypothetical protein BJX99DRAFT_80896 [Aspergillus californicus]